MNRGQGDRGSYFESLGFSRRSGRGIVQRGSSSTGHAGQGRQTPCLWKNGWGAAVADCVGFEASKDKDHYSQGHESEGEAVLQEE